MPPIMNAIQYYWDYISPFPLTSGAIERRLDALKEKAEGYLESLQVPIEQDGPNTTKNISKCDVTVKVNALKSGSFMSAHADTRTIYIHPLMLLKPSDIPWDLNYLGDDYTDYINRFSKWISGKFKIEEKDLEQIKHEFPYYLYIWQQPFLIPHSSAAYQSFPLNIIFVFVASSLSYHLWEKMFLNIKQRFQKSTQEKAE